MRHEPADGPLREPVREPSPDILPEGAPRGAPTVPDTNDTGITTPPISGWGERPARDDDADEDEEPDSA